MSDETLIDTQIDRLPTRIGKFIRRFAHLPDGSFTIQYTTNGFYVPDSKRKLLSEPPNNDVLYSETSKSIEDVVEKILVNIELEHRLETTGNYSEPYVYIDRELINQGVTQISIIHATGTATMMAPCVPLLPSYSHTYFLVQTEEYLLVFGRKGNEYFFRRNNIYVKLSIPSPKQISAETMSMAIVWGLDEIGITGYLASHEKKGLKPKWEAKSRDWKQTAPTVPPNSLYIWARKQLLISEKTYVNPGQVFNVVINALRGLNEEISRTNDLAGFWDEQRKGKKVIGLIPKREPVITKHIESQLRDITLQKNIDIMREIELGNSKLDLLFSAPLTDGTPAKVCVEVKKAHATDLAHGLLTQLPEYMRKAGTDYGIYCVLDFGTDYQHQINPFRELLHNPNFESNIELYRSNLGALLNMASSGLPFQNLVPIIIDVSVKPSASKM